MRSAPELLAPAGSFDTALAAFAAGADAVYLGLDAFSARAEAVNFTPDELRKLIAIAAAGGPRSVAAAQGGPRSVAAARRVEDNAPYHAAAVATERDPPTMRTPKRIYVTFNTLISDSELPAAIESLAILDELRPDGLIVQDLGIARIVRRHFPSLPLHASTQLVAHNLEGVLALRDLGFTRVVLARELSLDEIASIAKRCGVEIEVFVHGALCYSLSGLCLFSAMEKNRSGNRGRCAYCCRLAYTDASGKRSLPFSMRDLRLDDSLAALASAGVASFKIEGRMKSPLYVASAVKRYRELLDGVANPSTSRADLETVFSRRTTSLYIHGAPDPRRPAPSDPPVIDPDSLGHLGTPIGIVKHITRDRENRAWIRFHTSRALEKHDGLQFASPGGKPIGFGIQEMRAAISRKPAFSVPAGTDVEVLLPGGPRSVAAALRGEDNAPYHASESIADGAIVYCSASNEMKRRFPVPTFRPSDVAAGTPVDFTVSISPGALNVSAASGGPRFVAAIGSAACPHAAVIATESVPPAARRVEDNAPCHAAASIALPAPDGGFTESRNPSATSDAVRKAFSKLGGTNWTLNSIHVDDPFGLFVPPPVLNEARRRVVAELDAAQLRRRQELIAAARRVEDNAPYHAAADGTKPVPPATPIRATLKLRIDQNLPDNAPGFSEIIVAIGHAPGRDVENSLSSISANLPPTAAIRLALPVFTHEADFNALRSSVKRLLRAGRAKWEVADLAGLRLLRSLDVADITADWSLYAFNRAARSQLAELGISRFVVPPELPENDRDAISTGQCTPLPEFLIRQSTPLFISLTRPAADDPSRLTGLNGVMFTCHFNDGLWITSRAAPRTFAPPPGGGIVRTDISWDAPPSFKD